MRDRKTDTERVIFQHFIAAGGLLIDASSVEARQPPEPDLYCTVDGIGPLAFELVEVVDPDLARTANENARLAGTIKKDAGEHSAATTLKANLGDALVWVRFSDGTVRQRERSIAGVLKFLAELPDGATGEFRVGAEQQCPHVSSVEIKRADYPPGPHFQVTTSRSIADPLLKCLRDKWMKRYQAADDIHLLAYYNRHPAGFANLLIPDAETFIKENWSTSPFSRVWVYDVGESKILLDLARSSKPPINTS